MLRGRHLNLTMRTFYHVNQAELHVSNLPKI